MRIYQKLFFKDDQKATGLSAKDYLNNIRLEEAERYLIFSEESIKTIASRLGFSNMFIFSKFFKRSKGLSPLKYRNLYSKEEANFKSFAS